jgi:hypothetical protein
VVLNNNRLERIPDLSKLEKLNSLFLHCNQLRDEASIKQLGSLKKLLRFTIEENPLSDTSQQFIRDYGSLAFVKGTPKTPSLYWEEGEKEREKEKKKLSIWFSDICFFFFFFERANTTGGTTRTIDIDGNNRARVANCKTTLWRSLRVHGHHHRKEQRRQQETHRQFRFSKQSSPLYFLFDIVIVVVVVF